MATARWILPQCRYDAQCWRPGCVFWHEQCRDRQQVLVDLAEYWSAALARTCAALVKEIVAPTSQRHLAVGYLKWDRVAADLPSDTDGEQGHILDVPHWQPRRRFPRFESWKGFCPTSSASSLSPWEAPRIGWDSAPSFRPLETTPLETTCHCETCMVGGKMLAGTKTAEGREDQPAKYGRRSCLAVFGGNHRGQPVNQAEVFFRSPATITTTVSQVVSDTTAEVAAFNAYLDWCKEKTEDDGTEDRVLSWRTETRRCKIHCREVPNLMRVSCEAVDLKAATSPKAGIASRETWSTVRFFLFLLSTGPRARVLGLVLAVVGSVVVLVAAYRAPHSLMISDEMKLHSISFYEIGLRWTWLRCESGGRRPSVLS